MRFLPLILKNCWRNRRRTVLTVASIARNPSTATALADAA